MELLATITLGSEILVGEWFEECDAKPGNYNVYRVGDDPFAIFFNHVDNEQDFDKMIQTMDIVHFSGADGGHYGIITHNASDFRDQQDQWEDTMFDGSQTGFVTSTNNGDGSFSVFTNQDNSAFLLDDESMYLHSLISEHVDVDALYDMIDYIELEGIGYYANNDENYARVAIEPKDGERVIDVMADAIVTVVVPNCQ